MYLLIMSFFQTQASGESRVSQANIGKELRRTSSQIAGRQKSKNRRKDMDELDPFLAEPREKASLFFEIPAM